MPEAPKKANSENFGRAKEGEDEGSDVLGSSEGEDDGLRGNWLRQLGFRLGIALKDEEGGMLALGSNGDEGKGVRN